MTNTSTNFNRRRFLNFAAVGALSAAAGGVMSGHLLSHWYQNLMAAPSVPRSGIAVPPTTMTTPNGIRVHHIQTGYVAVKKVHRSYSGSDGQGILAIATAREWTEWLPITAWVIEHPEGVILIDTGETSAVNNPNYFNCDPASGFFYTSFLRFSVTPEEEIQNQLALLGIQPSDIRWVIQTHLHGDHIHGLQHFPKSEILMSPLDYPNSLGAVPCLYPDWLQPTLVTFKAANVAGFRQSFPLTRAGDVLILPTPGHSNGHQSVLLRDENRSYFLAGDTSFDEAQMLAGGIAGIAINPGDSRQTLANIRTYCASHPTVYLPSHDHESAKRLLESQTVRL